VNLKRALEAELANMHTSAIPIFYVENTSFREQVQRFSSAFDILISPHGAALTNLILMPKCGGVIEIMPFGYPFQAYFGQLAPAAGVTHGYVYIGENMANETEYWSATVKRRAKVRKANQCPQINRIVQGVRLFIQKYHECCQSTT
jgi:capsular polysaccharide biosynthesis protein